MNDPGKVVYSGAIDPASGQSEPSSPLRHLIAAASCVLLVLLGTYVWFMETSHFPRLEKGHYFGTITGVFGSDGTRDAAFYVERRAEANEIFVTLFETGWGPAYVNTAIDSATSGAVDESGEGALPLTLMNGGARLKLTGQRVAMGRFQGEARESSSGRTGRWTLERIEDVEYGRAQSEAVPDIRHWLFLFDELRAIEEETQRVRTSITKEGEEADKLAASITERDKLRARSEAKFAEVASAYDSVIGRLDSTRDHIEELARRVEIAHKVTPMGRLVTMSRETIDRESRWIHSMLRTLTPSDQGITHQDFAQASKLNELKAQIAQEKKVLLRYLRLEQERVKK